MNILNPERWQQLWQSATGQSAPDESFASIVRHYSEPHRHYHNLHHIADCLTEFDGVRHLANSPAPIELAIWFHDLIYDPKAGDNEEQSADLACQWLARSGAPVELVESVHRLVLATKFHDTSLHPNAPLMVDIDLCILGQSEPRFWEYEQQIQAEYSWVPKEVFATKRAEILEGFLSRKQIYQTDNFHQRLELTARTNLQASVRRLQSGIVP
jgi:predicted metal-dependent HD superfamily phosphohydrolase